MECFAGAAALGGVGAKEVFDYNRDNFMYDRRLRLKKELKLQEFRIAQAQLWREDVRDLISLTEYKMHVYLLVNVLMLGFTVVLYTEGELPHGTPNYLMMGYVIAITGSFMFLLLSIWMAMQAAVAAQSYETRLLTQLVRLPIPSWQEIEACRTYGSEFEQTEPRQMFRVPFVTGRQENLVQGHAAQASAAPERAQPPEPSEGSEASSSDIGDEVGSSSVGSRPSMMSSGAGAPPPLPAHSDPWGLERRGDEIYELGCKHGHDVARLRHIILARHAMTYWQTYDAFARVSMSIGVNQLLLALVYYVIGYIMVKVGSGTSATYGVILLTIMAETLTRLDMSLSLGQLRFLQVLLLVGPTASCFAGYHWVKHSEESNKTAESLIVLSFFSHSMYLALMTHFCRIRPQDNGAMLPTAFRSVLYLDVFGWLKLPQNEGMQYELSVPGSVRSRSEAPSPVASEHGVGPPQARASYYAHDYPGLGGDASPEQRTLASFEGESEGRTRPALAAMKYEDGRPVPQRPEDMAPSGAVQDMRGLPQAPQGKRLVGESEETEFYSAASWLQSGSRRVGEDPESWLGPVVTGHEKEPGLLPWWVFSTGLRALCLAWAIAAVYHSLGASEVWDFDNHDKGSMLETSRQESRAGRSTWLGLADFGGHLLDREAVHVAWPYPDLEPRSLACDASGNHFVVSDGLALYAASLRTENETVASRFTALRPARRRSRLLMDFKESPCSALVGEGLQDVALMCSGALEGRQAACRALVLYQQGRRVAACSLGAAGELEDVEKTLSGQTASIATDWLERFRGSGLAKQAGGEAGALHGRIEKAVAITFDAACGSKAVDLAAAIGNCTIVGTTRGRAVRLQRRVEGNVLIPVEAVHDKVNSKEAPVRPGAIRALSDGSVGMLEARGQRIQVLGSVDGALPGGFLPAPMTPMAAFCVGGGHVYALGEGPSPQLWRARLPPSVLGGLKS